MDMQARMEKSSVSAALGTALLVSAMKNPAAAVIMLAAGQMMLSAWGWMSARPVRRIWYAGTRESSNARRWMRSALCGACIGVSVWIGLRTLLFARFGLDAPMSIALFSCLAARAYALHLFSAHVRRAGAQIAASAAVMIGVSVCLYPLF